MNITDELREWAEQHKGWHLFDMQLNAIADRIDAEHEKELRETVEDCCEQRVVGNAFVTIQPRIDWMRMVDELDVFTQLVRGFAEQVEEDA